MERSLYKVAHALHVISDRIKELRKKKIMREEIALFSHAITSSTTYRKIISQLTVEIDKLYSLKDSTLNTLARKYNIRPVGYHVDVDGKKRDMYKVFTYKFHSNYCTSKNYLGEIDTVTLKDDKSLRVDKIYDVNDSIKDIYLTKEELVKIRKMSFSQAFKILRLFSHRKDIKFK